MLEEEHGRLSRRYLEMEMEDDEERIEERYKRSQLVLRRIEEKDRKDDTGCVGWLGIMDVGWFCYYLTDWVYVCFNIITKSNWPSMSAVSKQREYYAKSIRRAQLDQHFKQIRAKYLYPTQDTVPISLLSLSSCIIILEHSPKLTPHNKI